MKIVDYGMSGEGVAKENGKVYFVKNAMKGEDVEVKLLSAGKNFCRAEAIEIKNLSPQRCQPKCPYYNKCGGCQLQHFKYDEALKFKRNMLENTLKKVANISLSAADTQKSDKQYFYRNKSVFVAKVDECGTKFGMYEYGSHNFLEIKKCFIANEKINEVLNLAAKFYAERIEPNLKFLVIRALDDGALITLVCDGKIQYLNDFVEFFRKNHQNFGIFLNFNPSDDEILSGDFKHVYGLDHLTLTENGITQDVYAGSFLQVNSFVKNEIYSKILTYIDNNSRVIDAYCGAGSLSKLISRKALSVVGIESNPEAIKSAKEHESQNLKFVLGDVKKCLNKFLAKNQIIVLDPPRKGCEKGVLNAICKSQIEKVIYLSCSPTSLAKDLKILLEKYDLLSLTPFDMFPNTSSVETLCLLKMKNEK